MNKWSAFKIPVFVAMTMFLLPGCTTLQVPQSLQTVDKASRQALVVRPVSGDQGQLSAWQKYDDRWERVLSARVVIGRNGMAAPGMKKEGDGKTPSGIYALGPAFGYAPSIATGLDYRQATSEDFWVDDSRSLQYNQWVRGVPKASSFERLRRTDNLYQNGIVIDYNVHPIVPGAGSAIFLHVWRNSHAPTAGCVAMDQRRLRKILRWLNKEDQPVIILEPTYA